MKKTERNARLRRKVDSQKQRSALAKIVKVLRTVPAREVDVLLARAKVTLEKHDRWRSSMTGTGPLEVSQSVGKGISRAVESFAHDKKLDPEIWYHDEPIWRVRDRQNDLYHEVQIAAFSSEQDECLFFIPQAYAVDNGTVRAAKQERVKGLITFLPLRELEASDEGTIAKEVGKMLPGAWSNAESISESDLELVTREKSGG